MMINTRPQTSSITQRKISAHEARVEFARRNLAKLHYVDYRHYIAPWYVDGPHNRLIAQKLEQVELYIRTKGKEGIGRLIICMPPQYGKSKDIARLFPSWVIGKNPNAHIAITSYGADLADKHSAAVRDYVQSRDYQNIFGVYSITQNPVEVADDSASKSDWSLALPYDGGCVSRGIGGGLSGHPADLLIIDDPTKDIDEARSESHQKKLENWYDSVAKQRMSEGGAIVIDHTRWDPNDLIGQLLQVMVSDPSADQWDVVFLPALALNEDEYPKTIEEFNTNLARGIYIPMGGDQLGRQPGEALWPWKYSQAYVEKKKSSAKSPYIFASLDQQLPRPFSGGYFDLADIGFIEPAQIDADWKWVCYIDVALGRTKRSDFNAALIETLTPEQGDIVARDLIRERELEKFLRLLKLAMLLPENKHVIWGLEDVAFQSLAFQNFWKDPVLAGVAMVNFPVPEGTKEDRAANLSLRAKEGHFKLIKGAPTNAEVIRQLMEFPYGQHDDIVDTASGGPYMIAKYGNKRESKIL